MEFINFKRVFNLRLITFVDVVQTGVTNSPLNIFYGKVSL